MHQSIQRLIHCLLCVLALAPMGLFACDANVRSLLEQLPPETADSGLPIGEASYFDADARTSRVDALKLYWSARAGCDQGAAEVAQQIPDGQAYLVAAAMMRERRVDAAGYAVLEAHHLEGLIAPLLLLPENETYLYRYAQPVGSNKHAVRAPLEEMYKLLHAERQYERAVALVERNGPFAGNDDLIKLQLGWAYARIGRESAAQAIWQPLLKYAWARGIHSNTLALSGRVQEAWMLMERSPVQERGKMLQEYLEMTGDFEGTQQHIAWMSICQQARFSAMQRHYLRAMELAEAGRCESLYSYVLKERSHVLAQRYLAAELYEVAAKKGDGLLFRHLAQRAGVREGYFYIPTTPVIVALVANGRDRDALWVMQEDGPLKEVRSWTWSEIAYLAGPEFLFESWLGIYLRAEAPRATDAPLMQFAQSFATQRPAAAIAWFESNGSGLLAWQQKQFIFGLVRGLTGAKPTRSESEYRPVLPGYR